MEQLRNVKTNSLNVGMNKDVDPIFLKDGQYLNAINAKLNSHQGDYSLIQNEPSNFSCLKLSYDFIGSISLPGGGHAIFSTNDFYSEIGIFKPEECSYKALVTRNTCLGFKRGSLISGRAKENFDCSISIYWTDNLNPRRFLNLDNIPYTYTESRDACKTKNYTNIVDCDAMLIQPLLKYPNVSLSLGTDGNIRNGVYQAAVAYSINGQRITDYMSITTPIHVFSHENFGRSLEVNIQNLDTDFDEYELIIIYTIDGVTSVDKIGVYDTAQSKVVVTGVGQSAPNNKVLTLDEIITPTVRYERAEDVTSTSEYLIWVNPTSAAELNYQKLANNITTKWVAYAVPADYYKKGGNWVSYMRDEVYTFGIQWLYSTGYFSPAYHIPGREAEGSDNDPVITDDVYEVRDPNYTGTKRPKAWQAYNTGFKTPLEGTDNDKNIVAEGRMGYWESVERYPDNEALFGDLKCQPIRHHKLPDNTIINLTTQNEGEEEKLILLGVRFEDIEVPLDAEGNPRKDIVGYRIVRGDRFGNKSIVGKGLLFNMGKYTDENNDTVLYPNYAYNDLRSDPFLSSTSVYTAGAREKNFKPLGSFQYDKYTFHGPAFAFNNPTPGSELKIEGEAIADVKGKFTEVYKHPRHKLITNFAAGISVLIGLSEGYIGIKGRTCTTDEYEAKTTVIIPTVGYKRHIHRCETALTKLSVIPFVGLITGIIGGILAYGYYFNQGVDAALKVIKAFGQYQQYAYQYNSHGFYKRYDLPKLGSMRRRITYSQYLLPGMQSANTLKVNNFQRESSLYLQLDSALQPPTNLDNSRRTITDFGLCGSESKTTNTSTAVSYYGAIRRAIPNQYGQLDSIKYLDTGAGINYIDHVDKTVSSGITFGGDSYISRFTVKRKMSFFLQTLADSQTAQDGTEWNYMRYYNIPYPRFWINTEEYDADEVRTLKLASKNHNFDCRNEEKTLFIIKNRYFYLYNSGIIDFYVESEYNLENRNWDTTINGRHYDRFTYTDFNDLLRSDKIPYDNKYLFDNTYLKQLEENFIPKQNRNFDPELSENCYTTFKNRVIYSSPATKEQIKDNWRVYLPNNYYNFSKENGNLTTVKSFGRDRLLFLFDKSSPYVTMGIDTLKTENGIDVTLGDGGLFARAPQKLVHTDYAYGSSQSRWAFINTQYGGFYPSQRQGKVFRFTGDNIEEISKVGHNWWFKQNLPSKLVKQFPNYRNIDNPITGVALVSIYDNTDEIYYLSKIDYKIKNEWRSRAKYDPDLDQFFIGSTPIRFRDPNFFDDCSWTISYDVRSQAWISMHDWHPEWTFQTENHFLTYKNRTLWKHNELCNSYCNFYGVDYPFEIEYAVSNGQQTSVLSSLEWNLEAYKYYNDCLDPYHILDYNFDDLIIFNSEQNSGLVKLFSRPKQLVSPYPLNYINRTEAEYSKVEQKYRVNQFADLTRDRGEFSGKQIPMFTSSPNGYRKFLNRQALDYNKDQYQRKKFRHNLNKVILRKNINNDVKMIFKVSNTKQVPSFR